MKQAILLSVQPKHVNNILDGKKTLEIRKTNPKCDLPIDVYIYCTNNLKQYDECHFADTRKNPNCKISNLSLGKIVAKFTLNKVDRFCTRNFWGDNNGYFEITNSPNLEGKYIDKLSCLTHDEIDKYSKGNNVYAWHIENLVVFDEPKELGDFDHFNKDWHKLCGDGVYGCYRHAITNAPQSWQYVWTVDFKK